MKRFGDILNLLSGILLTVIVSDFDQLRTNFRALFLSQQQHYAVDILATTVTCTLIVVFIRNIHGSVRYDELISDSKSARLALDRSYVGRFVGFAFAIVALFCGPWIVDYFVAHHAFYDANAVKSTLIETPLSGSAFATVLFMPFAIYIVWDFLLWLLGTDGQECPAEVDNVAHHWMVLDAVTLIIVLTMGAVALFTSRGGGGADYELLTIGFIVISVVILVGDYWMNRSFYFPDPRTEE